MYLVRPEGLFSVCILEEVGNGEDVEAGVHHDEEEHTRLENTGKVGVVPHNVVQ